MIALFKIEELTFINYLQINISHSFQKIKNEKFQTLPVDVYSFRLHIFDLCTANHFLTNRRIGGKNFENI